MRLAARGNLELDAAKGSEEVVDSRPQTLPRRGGAARDQIGQHLAHLGLQRAAVERGADLQPALDLFVEIADGERRHEQSVTRIC